MSLADHLWQSTAFAALAGVLTLALRSNRARVRHWVWFAASVKFLIPLSLLIALGSQIEWKTQPVQPAVTRTMTRIVEPFTDPVAPIPVPPESPLPTVLFILWIAGTLGLSCVWFIRWNRIRRIVREGRTLPMNFPVRVVSSATMLEPGVFGILRPVLLLPDGIFDRLTSGQLKAVLAHELCHVRNRDNLLAAIHMFVETVFWFHPIVWWIGKRMVSERETACDEEVLQTLGEPQTYAEGILNVCKLYTELPMRCVSGVTGSDLKKRIEAIMQNRHVFRLNTSRRLILAAAGIATIALPLGVGTLLAQGSGLLDYLGKYSFEVATIRTAKPDGSKLMGLGQSGRPGRWEAQGITLRDLILEAYALTPEERLVGGPKWMQTNVWDIVAQAPQDQTRPDLFGPMLQTLLRDRFQLRLHAELRQMPVFHLTVSKPGKLTRSTADCTAMIAKGATDQVSGYCGLGVDPGAPRRLGGGSATMAQLARRLGSFPSIARPVIDRTGLDGMWDFEVKFMPADPTGVEDPLAPPIMKALQEQLGLKLESARASVEVLVVDQVEMPSEN